MTNSLNDFEDLNGGNDASATGRPSTRRWLLGIALTAGLNLAVTATAFGGLWLQGRTFELEQDRAITDQITSAQELISKSDNFTAQAAGFRALERIAEESPRERDRVVDLAEMFIANNRPVAQTVKGYSGRLEHVPNAGTQAAVDVIRSRNHAEDPDGPATRQFMLPAMKVEGVRLNEVMMRGTQAPHCFGRDSVWDEADLTDSNFRECGFKWARFVDATLNGVRFEGADLKSVEFTNADLTDANLDRAVIGAETVFRGADLSGATFTGTDLARADFSEVKSIAGADFSRAKGIEQAQNLLNAPGADSADWPPENENRPPGQASEG